MTRVRLEPRTIGVLVADGQPLFRDALVRVVRQRVDLRIVAEVASGREALAAIRARRPQVAVLDADLPGLSGERVANAVVRDELPTAVLVLASRVRAEPAYRALAAGARGYLAKSASGDQLADAIVRLAGGRTVLDPMAQACVADEIRLRARGERPALSAREREVLVRISQGLTAREIGRELHLGAATVKTHMLHLYAKLEVSERAAAVAEAMRRGLIE